eukprot:TRINITY_DN36050_c0_g1_i1.p1 TRINITY_DN36050_c0_g1~~TRINITY_DN36050_c0_g1_i1.p1  ORF type:complete len:100 (-),score=23.56 TRINITY_DN36050_c0_g1_i1:21-320(-)
MTSGMGIGNVGIIGPPRMGGRIPGSWLGLALEVEAFSSFNGPFLEVAETLVAMRTRARSTNIITPLLNFPIFSINKASKSKKREGRKRCTRQRESRKTV